MNLLDAVVRFVDDISVTEVEPITANGIATAIIRHIVNARPAQNEERQLQFIDGNHPPFLLLREMIIILH